VTKGLSKDADMIAAEGVLYPLNEFLSF
jgi:hypothetical protein